MSVKSSEPKSNLDQWAYAFNVIIIVVAGLSVWMSLYFLARVKYYPYYVSFAVLLLILSIVTVVLAINGFIFFLKVYGKLQKSLTLLNILGLAIAGYGGYEMIKGFINESGMDLNLIIVGIFLLYIGLVLIVRALMSRPKKSAW
ncbi:MAG: hypothetical protein ACTSU2_14800 [Promethearchaeota archaeon]